MTLYICMWLSPDQIDHKERTWRRTTSGRSVKDCSRCRLNVSPPCLNLTTVGKFVPFKCQSCSGWLDLAQLQTVTPSLYTDTSIYLAALSSRLNEMGVAISLAAIWGVSSPICPLENLQLACKPQLISSLKVTISLQASIEPRVNYSSTASRFLENLNSATMWIYTS
jgi:hypothetical protein